MPTRKRPDGRPEYFYKIKIPVGRIRQLYYRATLMHDSDLLEIGEIRIADWARFLCPGNKKAERVCDHVDEAYGRPEAQPFSEAGLRTTQGHHKKKDANGQEHFPPLEIREQPMCKDCRFKS